MGDEFGVWKNEEGAWSCHCPTCNTVKTFKVRKHALASVRHGTQCAPCGARQANSKKRDDPFVRKLKLVTRGAAKRNIPVTVDAEHLEEIFTGRCALTGWSIALDTNASLDRISSKKPYEAGNLQWVDKAVNYAKHTAEQNEFIALCRAITAHTAMVSSEYQFPDFEDYMS